MKWKVNGRLTQKLFSQGKGSKTCVVGQKLIIVNTYKYKKTSKNNYLSHSFAETCCSYNFEKIIEAEYKISRVPLPKPRRVGESANPVVEEIREKYQNIVNIIDIELSETIRTWEVA